MLDNSGKSGILRKEKSPSESSNRGYLQEKLNFITETGEKGFIPQYAEFNSITAIVGKGTKTKINDISRLISSYGGTASEWKKQAGKIETDLYIYDIHWYEKDDGIQYDPKLKRRSVKK